MTARNIVLLLLPQICIASLSVTLKLVRYDEIGQGKLANGQCCAEFFARCILPCDPSIRVCVSSQRIEGNCHLYQGETKPLGHVKTVTFGNSVGDIPNPLILSVERWEEGLYFNFTIKNGGRRTVSSLVDRLPWHLNKTQILSHGIGKISQYKISGTNVALTFHIGIECSKDFYGDQCKVFCKDTDGQSGHYNCGKDGHKLCMKGWKGRNCTEQENACDHNSCENNATCYIAEEPHATYRCECTSEYTGTYCEERRRGTTISNATTGQRRSTMTPSTPLHLLPTAAYTTSSRRPVHTMRCTPLQALQFEVAGQKSSLDEIKHDIKRFLSENGVGDIYNVDVLEKGISGHRRPCVLVTPLRQSNITENMGLLLIKHVKHLDRDNAEGPSCIDVRINTKGHVQTKFESSEVRISAAAIAGISMGVLLVMCIIIGAILLQRCWGHKIRPESQRSKETEAEKTDDISNRKERQTSCSIDVFLPAIGGDCAVISLPPRTSSLGKRV